MRSNQVHSGGIGVLSVLQIIFVVLKLIGLIDWSWVAVFIPTFIGFGINLILIIILLVCKYYMWRK